MTEATSEQLAEIQGQAESTPATEYTPPEGWQEVPLGEPLKGGDEYHAGLDRFIRPIEPKPQPEPIQVREGRWKTRAGDIRNVTPTPEGDGRKERYPWWDAQWHGTWTADGRYHLGAEGPLDLVEYLGPIEPQPEQKPQPPMLQDADERIRLLRQANDSQAETIGRLQAAIDERAELGGADQTRAELQARIRELEAIRDTQAATIEELRSEVSYVQRLLGESRQRVTQLEELVGSLRTINEAQEKAFVAANRDNNDLQHRLNVVAAEWAEQAETIRRLQIELDAAQQVPQAIADRFEEGWNQGTARAVESVLAWLEPIRLVDHPNLSNETLQHLPQIMRHLTGLAQD